VWTLNKKTDEKLSKYSTNTDEAAAYAASITDRDVYFGVGLSIIRKQPNQRFEANEVTALPGLWIDVDYLDDAHKKQNLPPTKEDAIELLKRMPLPFSKFIHTGHGYQAYWLFERVEVFETDLERARLAALCEHWQRLFKFYSLEKGWDCDSTFDLARVFRVPGTLNHKDELIDVRNVPCAEARYSIEALTEALNTAISTVETQTPDAVQNIKRTRKAKSAQSNVGDLKLREDACAPQSKFQMLYDVHQKFKGSWNHNRSTREVQDQSPSGFDMSLATIAAMAGWSDQEIADLIIQHRVKWKEDPKLGRQDYYQNTIDQARIHVLRYTANVENKKEEERERAIKLNGKPKVEIDATIKEFSHLTALAWDALVEVNEPERLFRHSNGAVRVDRDDLGDPLIVRLDETLMTYELTQFIKWSVKDANGAERNWTPTARLVNNILAVPDMPLSVLRRVVTAPVFAADGTLQTIPGYHHHSQTYYAQTNGLCLESVSEQPTQNEIVHAKAVIHTLIGEFPFTSESEYAHAVSLMLLPFAYDLIDDLTPLHVIEAPDAGNGKTLLAEVLAFASTLSPSLIAEVTSEEEWRKHLLSTIRNDPSYLIIDNVHGRLQSPSLASLITTRNLEGRDLGVSRNLRLSVHCAFVVTANNPVFTTEMMRRTVRIRLDAEVERPWERDDFKIKSLKAWAFENRAELVWSALTLIQAWIAEGRPQWNGKKLGSFESWSGVMGGILETAGISGFLKNTQEFYAEADTERIAWNSFIAEWWHMYGDRAVTTAELYKAIKEKEILDLGKGDSDSYVQAKTLKLNFLLKKNLNTRPYNLLTRRVGEKRGVACWQLTYMGKGKPPVTRDDEQEAERRFASGLDIADAERRSVDKDAEEYKSKDSF
jgi:hypothetical protein